MLGVFGVECGGGFHVRMVLEIWAKVGRRVLKKQAPRKSLCRGNNAEKQNGQQ